MPTESVRGELGVVIDPILKGPSLEGYTFPPVRVPGLFDDMSDHCSRNPDRFVMWRLRCSLFERAWSLRGFEAFLMDMVQAPEFVDDLLDGICAFNLGMIERACRFPIDCVGFSDDYGAQRGLILSPELWRRFIKPRLAKMVGAAASYGKVTFLHSDGDIRAIVPDLIEVGLTILNPIQPDCMDIYALKRTYGRDLTFWGGISVQHLLPNGSPDAVRSEVRRLLREMGAGGGFIAAPTNLLGPDIPPENAVALIEELTRQVSG